MNRKAIDMTTGSPLRLLIAFTLPMIFGNIFQQVYSMVDTVVVGRFVSKEALAAVGATGSIMFLMISVIIGFTVGTSIVTAQAAGAKNTEEIRTIFATAAFLILAESALLCLLGNLFLRPALKLLHTPEGILDRADLYLRINFSTCIAPIAYNMYSQFMRSLGDSRTPLAALIISSVVNIILDLALVLLFDMGVAGVAAATAIAQALSAVFCLVSILKKFPETVPLKGGWKPSAAVSGRIIRFGIPMSLQNLIVSLGMMVIQSMINGFGTDYVAGYTAANRVDQIALQFLNSTGSAVSTYAGQNFGAKKKERIFAGLRSGLLMSSVMAVFLSAVLLIAGRFLLMLFLKPEETTALSAGVSYLRIICSFYLFCGAEYVISNLQRGVGEVAVPTAVSIIELALKIGAAFLLSARFGIAGIYVGWPASWIAADLLLLAYYYLRTRPKLKKLGAPETAE